MSRPCLSAVYRLAISFVGISFCIALASPPAWCDPGEQLKEPTKLPDPQISSPISQDEDILLIMPSADADKTGISDALQEVKGTIIGTIGEGPLTIYKVKTEKGKLLDTQKKLARDKNFSIVECNYKFKIKAVGSKPVNDPYFANEWHLAAVNAVNAWALNRDGAAVIGVLDTGVQASNRDLSGKVYAGYDAVTGQNNAQADVMGHGTMVSTTAAAIANNSYNTAGVARNAYIYPIRIATADGSVDESAVLQGIYTCGQMGIKIINISANADTPYSFSNKMLHPALHMYLKWFHDTKGGLVFNSAGNDGRKDNNGRSPYLIVCSAINTSYSLASFSTYGNSLWFTGPGVSIFCSDRAGKVVSVSGTSFSAPICAAVAAMVWGANSRLKNTQVEQIMVQTCYKAGRSNWTQYYGYGMPNANAAVRMATGQ